MGRRRGHGRAGLESSELVTWARFLPVNGAHTCLTGTSSGFNEATFLKGLARCLAPGESLVLAVLLLGWPGPRSVSQGGLPGGGSVGLAGGGWRGVGWMCVPGGG